MCRLEEVSLRKELVQLLSKLMNFNQWRSCLKLSHLWSWSKQPYVIFLSVRGHASLKIFNLKKKMSRIFLFVDLVNLGSGIKTNTFFLLRSNTSKFALFKLKQAQIYFFRDLQTIFDSNSSESLIKIALSPDFSSCSKLVNWWNSIVCALVFKKSQH